MRHSGKQVRSVIVIEHMRHWVLCPWMATNSAMLQLLQLLLKGLKLGLQILMKMVLTMALKVSGWYDCRLRAVYLVDVNIALHIRHNVWHWLIAGKGLKVWGCWQTMRRCTGN